METCETFDLQTEPERKRGASLTSGSPMENHTTTRKGRLSTILPSFYRKNGVTFYTEKNQKHNGLPLIQSGGPRP